MLLIQENYDKPFVFEFKEYNHETGKFIDYKFCKISILKFIEIVKLINNYCVILDVGLLRESSEYKKMKEAILNLLNNHGVEDISQIEVPPMLTSTVGFSLERFLKEGEPCENSFFVEPTLCQMIILIDKANSYISQPEEVNYNKLDKKFQNLKGEILNLLKGF